MKTKSITNDGWVYAVVVHLSGDDLSTGVISVHRTEHDAIERFNDLNLAEYSRRRHGGSGKYVYSVIPVEFYEFHPEGE